MKDGDALVFKWNSIKALEITVGHYLNPATEAMLRVLDSAPFLACYWQSLRDCPLTLYLKEQSKN